MAHIMAQVAVEAAVDKTALDPKHKYFDAKSDPEKVGLPPHKLSRLASVLNPKPYTGANTSQMPTTLGTLQLEW